MPEITSRDKKMIVLVGPTASGKTELAVEMALFIKKKFKKEVEIISADSRQIYKDLKIGTNQPPKKLISTVPHHLLNFIEISKNLSVFQYQKKAIKIIKNLWKANKLPIICGGSGFYIQAIVDGIIFPHVPPNFKLRKNLEKLSNEELSEIIRKFDEEKWKVIDKKNKKRLIRAIEILKKLKKIPKLQNSPLTKEVLIIGIKIPKNKLTKKIEKRTTLMLKKGLLKEANLLLKRKIKEEKIKELGFIYQAAIYYLKGEIKTKEELKKIINQKTLNYVKRQITWFKKDKRIKWVENKKEALKLVSYFLKNKENL